MGESTFDGGLLQLIGWSLLGGLVSVLSLGLLFLWHICNLYRWEAAHTMIDGRRLKFSGTATQLFGNYIKWFLLTLITLGIYGFWMVIKIKQWKTKHTHFAPAYAVQQPVFISSHAVN